MINITKDTIIGDILDMDQSTAPYFMEIGMHCLGCPASRGESSEEACEVHGVDGDELLEKLNTHLAAKKACVLPTLDARLTAAAELVRPGQPVADIGCDHGKLTAVLAAAICPDTGCRAAAMASRSPRTASAASYTLSLPPEMVPRA